jgi:hypothetical protein
VPAGPAGRTPVFYIIHWIELRGIGTYEIGWTCV